jgi:hypothetical protein
MPEALKMFLAPNYKCSRHVFFNIVLRKLKDCRLIRSGSPTDLRVTSEWFVGTGEASDPALEREKRTPSSSSDLPRIK